ncbi:Protein disulfide isomerase-like 1-6 [Platanthera guangdongensis]|uniref:Protein disulfide isomerase-like 1-6 n=1 Tax=Platanthera guangdongensis TaxID=2320717 RepID=A0ABR2MUW0_9ASPA
MGSSVIMAKLDAERYAKAAELLGIKGFPTILLYVNSSSRPYTGGFIGEKPFTRLHPDYEETLIGMTFDQSSWKFIVAVAGFYRPFVPRLCEELFCAVFDSETNSWTRFVSSLYDC